MQDLGLSFCPFFYCLGFSVLAEGFTRLNVQDCDLGLRFGKPFWLK